jgi:hypothetical protein
MGPCPPPHRPTEPHRTSEAAAKKPESSAQTPATTGSGYPPDSVTDFDTKSTPTHRQNSWRSHAEQADPKRRETAWLSASAAVRVRLLSPVGQLPKLRVAGSSPVVRSLSKPASHAGYWLGWAMLRKTSPHAAALSASSGIAIPCSTGSDARKPIATVSASGPYSGVWLVDTKLT